MRVSEERGVGVEKGSACILNRGEDIFIYQPIPNRKSLDTRRNWRVIIELQSSLEESYIFISSKLYVQLFSFISL